MLLKAQSRSTPSRRSGSARLQSRGQETRARILEAAESLFAQHSYAGTSLDAIAKEAGIHKPGISYYFPTKKALYHAVLAEAMSVFEKRSQEALSSPGSPRQRLIRGVEAWVDALAERPTAARLILHEAANPNPTGLPEDVDGPGFRAYYAVDAAFKELMPDAHPDDALHFQSTLGGSTIFFLVAMDQLLTVGHEKEFKHSIERHKQLIVSVAKGMLRDLK